MLPWLQVSLKLSMHGFLVCIIFFGGKDLFMFCLPSNMNILLLTQPNSKGSQTPIWTPSNLGFATPRQTHGVKKGSTNFHCFPHGLLEAAPISTRLAVMMVLQGKVGELFAMLAPVCSSYSSVNIASSCRTILTPLGLTTSPSVRRGNKMVARRDWAWTCLCGMGVAAKRF